jgi:biotin-(acetyl-CoA carboxylase) ligase
LGVQVEFPPLLTGLAVAGDPFEAAVSAASGGEPGTVFYSPDEAVMRAAILLAPETPLAQAVSVSFAVALGLNDAIGVLAPPEVGVHLVWPDRLRVNGGLCGRIRMAASAGDPSEEPDWLVVGAEVQVLPLAGVEPGRRPNETCLHDEGCGDISAMALLEAWGRHMMSWLHVYLTDGFAELHEDWRAKAHGLGGEIEYPEAGLFVGLDEWGGMILKDGEATRILPLTRFLETE